MLKRFQGIYHIFFCKTCIFFYTVFFMIILYYSGIYGAFVLDDITYFVDNDILKHLGPFDFKEIFLNTSNYWGELLPVRDYLYVLEHTFFDQNPIGYHVVSLILFMACAFVLYQWIKELLNYFAAYNKNYNTNGLQLAAYLVIVVFICHPVNVEVVAYISGQKDVLSGFFILSSLLFFTKIARSEDFNWKWFLLGIVLHYLAVMSKQIALASILFVPVLWYILGNLSFKKWIYRVGIWILVNIPVLVWTFYTASKTSQYQANLINTPFLERIPRAIHYLGFHIQHIIWPYPLNVSYVSSKVVSDNTYFTIGLLFLLIALIIFIWRKKSIYMLGISVFLIYLLPVLQILPEMSNDHLYDRYLLIPQLGAYLLFVALIFSKVIAKHRKLKILLVIFTGVVIVNYAVMTSNYIPVFKNNLGIAENEYKIYPNDENAIYSFAQELMNSGEIDRAEEFVKEEAFFKKVDWLYNFFLGRIAYDRGDVDLAYTYQVAAYNKSNKPGVYQIAGVYLAKIMIEKGEYDNAYVLLNELKQKTLNEPNLSYHVADMLQELATKRNMQ